MGRVVYARVGIAFTNIEANKGLVLEKWIAGAAKKKVERVGD